MLAESSKYIYYEMLFIFRTRENTEVFLFIENQDKNLRIFAVD